MRVMIGASWTPKSFALLEETALHIATDFSLDLQIAAPPALPIHWLLILPTSMSLLLARQEGDSCTLPMHQRLTQPSQGPPVRLAGRAEGAAVRQREILPLDFNVRIRHTNEEGTREGARTGALLLGRVVAVGVVVVEVVVVVILEVGRLVYTR